MKNFIFFSHFLFRFVPFFKDVAKNCVHSTPTRGGFALALAQSLGCFFKPRSAAAQLGLAASRLVVLSVECTDSRELSKF